MFKQRGNVESRAVENATPRIAHRNNGGAILRQQFRRNTPRIAEPLNRHGRPVQLDPCDFAGGANHEQATAGSRLIASKRSAQEKWFAGHHARGAAAVSHAVGVHDPRHSLCVGINIGCGDVLVGSDNRGDFVSVAPCQVFQLIFRELSRIANDAAFCPAERNIHDRAFPRHP